MDDFKQMLPLVAAVCNPGLRERHWVKMSEIAGQDLTPAPVSCPYACMPSPCVVHTLLSIQLIYMYVCTYICAFHKYHYTYIRMYICTYVLLIILLHVHMRSQYCYIHTYVHCFMSIHTYVCTPASFHIHTLLSLVHNTKRNCYICTYVHQIEFCSGFEPIPVH